MEIYNQAKYSNSVKGQVQGGPSLETTVQLILFLGWKKRKQISKLVTQNIKEENGTEDTF